MEFMEHGNLHNEIHDFTKIYDESSILSWIKQIGTGLQYLHDHGIIHRDVKPKNILLTQGRRVKLADFGLARNISSRHSNTSGIIGTGSYIAPEVLMSNDYGPPADVFSFGVTIWEIVHRKHPSENLKVTKDGTENSCVLILPMDSSKINRKSSTFLKRCWSTKATDRPSIQDIIRNGISKPSSTLLVTRSDYKTAILNRDRNKWINVQIDSLAEIPPESDLLCLDDDLYMINVHSYGILYKLDKNMAWIRMADMNVKRTQIKNNCLSFNGFIWVFGGENTETSGILNSVEKYDPTEDKWIEMPEMKYARCSAAVVGYHDKIIICGGIGPQQQAQYSVECFDLKTGIWAQLADLPIPLALGHSISYYKNCLIIMGGYDEFGPSIAVLKFDFIKGEWTQLKTWWLREGSHFMAGIIMDDELYAFCGPWKEYSHMSQIDISGNYIEKIGAPIPSEPFYETCVVISEKLTNRLCHRGRRKSARRPVIPVAIEENFSEWKEQFGAEW